LNSTFPVGLGAVLACLPFSPPYDLVCKQLIHTLAHTHQTNGAKTVTFPTGESTESCQG